MCFLYFFFDIFKAFHLFAAEYHAVFFQRMLLAVGLGFQNIRQCPYVTRIYRTTHFLVKRGVVRGIVESLLGMRVETHVPFVAAEHVYREVPQNKIDAVCQLLELFQQISGGSLGPGRILVHHLAHHVAQMNELFQERRGGL